MAQLNQNIPNGIPPQFTKAQMNGLDSVHSSRDSSPSSRHHQISNSQLPSVKTQAVSVLTKNYANLEIYSNKTLTPPLTPSKEVVTSTPVENSTEKSINSGIETESTVNFNHTSILSPISSKPLRENKLNNENGPRITSHSSNLSHVPLPQSLEPIQSLCDQNKQTLLTNASNKVSTENILNSETEKQSSQESSNNLINSAQTSTFPYAQNSIALHRLPNSTQETGFTKEENHSSSTRTFRNSQESRLEPMIGSLTFPHWQQTTSVPVTQQTSSSIIQSAGAPQDGVQASQSAPQTNQLTLGSAQSPLTPISMPQKTNVISNSNNFVSNLTTSSHETSQYLTKPHTVTTSLTSTNSNINVTQMSLNSTLASNEPQTAFSTLLQSSTISNSALNETQMTSGKYSVSQAPVSLYSGANVAQSLQSNLIKPQPMFQQQNIIYSSTNATQSVPLNNQPLNNRPKDNINTQSQISSVSAMTPSDLTHLTHASRQPPFKPHSRNSTPQSFNLNPLMSGSSHTLFQPSNSVPRINQNMPRPATHQQISSTLTSSHSAPNVTNQALYSPPATLPMSSQINPTPLQTFPSIPPPIPTSSSIQSTRKFPHQKHAAPFTPLTSMPQPASTISTPLVPTYQSLNQFQVPNSNPYNQPPMNHIPLTGQNPPNILPPQQNYTNRPPNIQSSTTQQNFNQFPQQTHYPNYGQSQQSSVTQSGFNTLWGADNIDLLQTPNILPPTKVEMPRVNLRNEILNEANCSPDIFRCTMTKIPESASLLNKSRLPLGILIHPFKDLDHLPVIQCNTIVRCRACRTYINPFIFFVDSKRWKCNLCYRLNELPEEFQYDPISKTYGDPSRRPEIKMSTIEYIAPAEYMLRPPQPAVYLFLLDISRSAIESGYLKTICDVLSAELLNLPGDSRTQIGFIAYDSALHFFSLGEGLNQPHEMIVLDTDDVFLPCPDNLLVNLQDRQDLILELLRQLPTMYETSYESISALGPALQAGHRLMAATGGRITVFQATLPTVGVGALLSREDPNQRASNDVQHLNPAIDFYKRLALECSAHQIAVDLFLLNSHYVDLATMSGISRFSGGCIYHIPLFKSARPLQNDNLERSFRRYLTRKIGFEAVMRVRCTRGLSIHSFHGHFFVRSTDLLSLPNINPDAGFGMQISIEENLSEVQTVCFQAALLYTSSKGERRIRVHTMCLPIASTVSDILSSADQQAIVALLAKMAVDRSMQTSLNDAREAFINAAVDILTSFKLAQNMGQHSSGLLVPSCLRLLPLYISGLLKQQAFRIGVSTRLDDRVKAMCDMKTLPLPYLIQQIYPDLYPVHNLQDQSMIINTDEELIPQPPRLQLSARVLDANGAYLLDQGHHMLLIIGTAIPEAFLTQVLGMPAYNAISDQMYELPLLENEHNRRLRAFLKHLNEERPVPTPLHIIRDNSSLRSQFFERLIEDRVENALSYHEFLQHLKTQVK